MAVIELYVGLLLSMCMDMCKSLFIFVHLAGTLSKATYSTWAYIDVHSIYETIGEQYQDEPPGNLFENSNYFLQFSWVAL